MLGNRGTEKRTLSSEQFASPRRFSEQFPGIARIWGYRKTYPEIRAIGVFERGKLRVWSVPRDPSNQGAEDLGVLDAMLLRAAQMFWLCFKAAGNTADTTPQRFRACGRPRSLGLQKRGTLHNYRSNSEFPTTWAHSSGQVRVLQERAGYLPEGAASTRSP